MTKEINNTAPDAVDELAMQYDEQAKKALGYKTVLAFILSKAVSEFKGMSVKDIVELIEGEVYISKVPVDPGHTNITNGERITGLNTEDAETNEGLIRYDILFKVRTSKEAKKSYGIIINVEMQEETDSRDLCRMLNTLFAVNLENKERFKMLMDDFGIDIDENLREEVEVMCNLGQGLLEKGEKRGQKIGEKRGEKRGQKIGAQKTKEEDIINFYKVGVSLIMIAQAMSKTEEEIKKVLTDHGVNLDH